MKIIPDINPVMLDGFRLKEVQSVELQNRPAVGGTDIYAIITVKLDHVQTSVNKIELFSQAG